MPPSSFWCISSSTAQHGILLVDFEVQVPVVFAPGIEAFSTLRTFASAAHVFVDTQYMLASSAKHHFVLFSIPWPDSRLVIFACVVAADASVELLAAKMLNGDNVQGRVPMAALSQWGDGDPVNSWR